MFENPSEQWQQLTEHYREMFDGELEEIAADFKDLTPTAQEVLRNEMRNRGLGDPAAPAKRAVRAAPKPVEPSRFVSDVDPDTGGQREPNAAEEPDGEREFTWKTLLCECDSEAEAWEIHKALSTAGIDNWVEMPGRDRVSCPRVVVAADQLEEAQEIASKPIPKEVIDEYNEEAPEFVAPKCPQCGAEESVLESADPVNSWLCEACGKEWTEPAADPQ
jgi:ribosomal protein S27E